MKGWMVLTEMFFQFYGLGFRICGFKGLGFGAVGRGVGLCIRVFEERELGLWF